LWVAAKVAHCCHHRDPLRVEVIVGRPELTISSGMSPTDQTEREIERAWLQHDPQRNTIPQEIWRQLRRFKREFEPTSAKIKATLQDEALLRSLVEQCCRRRGIARARVLKDIRRTFSGAVVKIVDGEILEISWIAPSPPVILDPKNPAEQQECLLCCYAVAWPTPPFGIRLRSAWSLEVPDHAAGRYLQRIGENADLKSALFEAANWFYSADMTAVKPHVGRGTDIYLPAGGGSSSAPWSGPGLATTASSTPVPQPGSKRSSCAPTKCHCRRQ
jgi:hypothetical protein